MEDGKTFQTPCPFLAAALEIMTGLEAELLITPGRKVHFLFPATPTIYKAMENYYSGAALVGCEFADKVRTLRRKMYQFKDTARAGAR